MATPKQKIALALSLICNLSTKQWRIISTDLRKETVLSMFGKIKGNSSTCLLHYPIHVYRWMYVFSAVSLQKLYAICNDKTAQQFILIQIHDDVIKKNGNISALLALCGGSHRWPHTKASDGERWCFLWPATEYTVGQTIVRLVIWDAIAPIMTSL